MSDCDVCLYADDDIDNDFSVETIRRARKAHVCCECEGPILPGQMYYRHAGRSDGQVWVYKTCPRCHEVRTVFYCGGAYYLGTLWLEMQEQAFPALTTASACFTELSPEGKAFVMERWSAWKFPPLSSWPA